MSDKSTKFSFVDIANDPNAKYIQALADKGIVSTVNEKFYPNNFIRLNEVTKMFVNAIRLNK
jgi:disulfide oxidoreductase YuzD